MSGAQCLQGRSKVRKMFALYPTFAPSPDRRRRGVEFDDRRTSNEQVRSYDLSIWRPAGHVAVIVFVDIPARLQTLGVATSTDTSGHKRAYAKSARRQRAYTQPFDDRLTTVGNAALRARSPRVSACEINLSFFQGSARSADFKVTSQSPATSVGIFYITQDSYALPPAQTNGDLA